MADPFKVEIAVDDSEIRAALQRSMTANSNMRPVFKVIGERLLRSTEERFDTETDPTGKPWAPLQISSLYAGYGKKKYTQKGMLTAAFSRYLGARKILTKSGQLRRSIYSKPTDTQVAIGTGKIYGATHQFGRGNIPARPFLGITVADRVEILELVQEYNEQALAGP